MKKYLLAAFLLLFCASMIFSAQMYEVVGFVEKRSQNEFSFDKQNVGQILDVAFRYKDSKYDEIKTEDGYIFFYIYKRHYGRNHPDITFVLKNTNNLDNVRSGSKVTVRGKYLGVRDNLGGLYFNECQIIKVE